VEVPLLRGFPYWCSYLFFFLTLPFLLSANIYLRDTLRDTFRDNHSWVIPTEDIETTSTTLGKGVFGEVRLGKW